MKNNKNEFVNHTSAQPYPTTKPRETAPENYYSTLTNEYDDDGNVRMIILDECLLLIKTQLPYRLKGNDGGDIIKQ